MLKSLAARSLVADRAAQQVSLGRLFIGFNRLPRASRFAGAPPYRNEMADASSRFACARAKNSYAREDCLLHCRYLFLHSKAAANKARVNLS